MALASWSYDKTRVSETGQIESNEIYLYQATRPQHNNAHAQVIRRLQCASFVLFADSFHFHMMQWCSHV